MPGPKVSRETLPKEGGRSAGRVALVALVAFSSFIAYAGRGVRNSKKEAKRKNPRIENSIDHGKATIPTKATFPNQGVGLLGQPPY